MKRSISLRGALRCYGIITLGCLVYAVAFNWFFLPNDLTLGGFTGLAQVLNALAPALPIGAVTIALNVPLFVLGARKIGLGLLLSSLYATALSSLLVDLVGTLAPFQPMEPLLACVYGGALLGASIGLLLLANATTGGTELLARLLKLRFRHLSMGRLCLICDGAVVCLYALAFDSVHSALYSIIAIYISSHTIDMVLYGSRTAQLAIIITARGEALRPALLSLDLGVTLLPATGGFTGEGRDVLLCVFRRHHISRLKARVHEIDPAAFLIVTQAHEVLGNRFGDYSQESL